jgi:hypothetical protein
MVLVLIPQCGMVRAMSGITFMVDSHGTKTAAVIDLRRHRKLWEDFYDTVLAESRADEPRESLDFVKRRLKLAKANG